MLQEDGNIKWLYSRILPIFDEHGEIVEWVGASSDITARKQAEQEFRDEKYFLEQITDHIPHLIYVFDVDEQCFVYINHRIEELTGITQEYVYGMGPHLFKKILHPDDLRSQVTYYRGLSTLKPGEVREHEFRLKAGDHFRWFRSKDRIFKMEGDRVKLVIGFGEEVTYEKTLQGKIQQVSTKIGLN
jgi:PAS domain S-box-containing protein